MIKMLFCLLILCFSSNFAMAAKYKKAKFSTCSYNKITPINYLAYYNITKKRYKRYAKKAEGSAYNKWIDFLDQETGMSTNKDMEVCEWNKFILTDFIFYHEQAQSLFGDHKKLPFLEIRDVFYKNWLVELEKKTRKAAKSISPIVFKNIEHKSREFPFLTKLTGSLNKAPKGEGEIGEAELAVYNLLEGKSVFNSIFAGYAKKLFLDNSTLKIAKCISGKIEKANGENLWNELITCDSSTDKIMDVLGVLASQRMYLIRDFKVVMYENLDDASYAQVSELFDVTSTIYFQLETYGNKYGHGKLYPPKFSDQAYSYKPYHFYSVAFIAMKLHELGFSEDIIKKASVKYARKYKKNIKRIGILYNILLLQNINKGTVGDYDKVLAEQDLGALFGIELGQGNE